MKNTLFVLIMIISSGSMALPTLFLCKNSKHQFSIAVINRTKGFVQQKTLSCPIKISDLEVSKGTVSENNIQINFEVPSCHEKIFYQKGFLHLSTKRAKRGYIASILALRGFQTFECETTEAEIKKLLTL